MSVGGVPHLFGADAATAVAPSADTVHLLPGFDELLLGYGDRSASLARDDVPKVVPARNGLSLPTITVDGRVVGTWRRRLVAGRVELETQLFEPMGIRPRSRLDRSASRYAAYLGRELVWPESTPRVRR